ncbi:hypothetical protein NDU88_002904 [Pleurodeles waltl]|uniref:Uncharacterized protein n=1 Tax=Pleurodeles waltl TaxID=8319 RepID=A0AAV7KWQ0_PLEWA|nr:hypothetical protein NDU88_002904 [Pleurodeles waltl]
MLNDAIYAPQPSAPPTPLNAISELVCQIDVLLLAIDNLQKRSCFMFNDVQAVVYGDFNAKRCARSTIKDPFMLKDNYFIGDMGNGRGGTA